MSAFVKMLDKVRQRNFGGTDVNCACEPYVSGYGFIKWYLPHNLGNYFKALKITDSDHQTGSAENYTQAEKYLSAACVGLTPLSQTINGVDYDASAGVKFSVMTKVINGYSINIKYLEMSGTPIFRIHKAWIEYLRDAKTGFNISMTNGGLLSQKNDYCGNVLYWTTKPDGVTVEFCALYSGVYPTVDPQDAFSFDIGSIDKVELDFSYHTDYVWTDPWVRTLAEKYAKGEKEKAYGDKDATTWSGYTGRWNTEGKRGGYEAGLDTTNPPSSNFAGIQGDGNYNSTTSNIA